MKTLKKVLALLFIAIILFTSVGFSLVCSAEIPYESYTYWTDVGTNDKDVYNRAMYEPYCTISASSLGVEDFSKINDISTDDEGNIYILDSDSRIVIANKNYQFIREIGAINGTERFDNANSVFVHKDKTLYICDTDGKRVIHITNGGNLIEIITLPDSPLIPEDYDFRPTKVGLDSYENLYILSDGSYYGALLYAPDRSFLGFYGANSVNTSISNVITNIKNRILPNNVKKGNTAQQLPYCFVDIEVDDDGFVYTCNGYTQKYGRQGQIRKLSPGTGSNILKSSDKNFVDADVNTTSTGNAMAKQDIMDIEVDSNGFIYGLESAFGRIFLYDDSCRILTAFGGGMGSGSQVGTFVTVSGMAINNDGEQVLVSDSEANLVTVFSVTEYGNRVKQLVKITLEGKYTEAKSGWEEILSLDNNFQPAYSGLARAYLSENDYSNAMKYAKIGFDRETYGLAFEYWRKDFINENFIWIFVIALIAIVGVIVFLAISMHKKLVFIKNAEMRLMFSTMLHPSNCFSDIKEKRKGSISLCVITVILYYLTTILQTLKGGFLFSVYDHASFNSIWVLVRSVGLVVLWIVADWMVCTLLGGKGKFREIIIITCYSLWPLIIEKILRLVFTNVLLPTEASFLNILDTIAIIYFIILMVIGLLKIHDFSMSRLIGTSALAIVGIAAIIFLIIMIVILVQQFWGFICTLVSELLTI